MIFIVVNNDLIFVSKDYLRLKLPPNPLAPADSSLTFRDGLFFCRCLDMSS